jgi:hypothetical protein
MEQAMTNNIDYATPVTSRSYWPEAILGAIGLGLVSLGGCFLIGVAIMFDGFAVGLAKAGPITRGESAFVAVLYICAAACFAAAAFTLVTAIRRLVRA